MSTLKRSHIARCAAICDRFSVPTALQCTRVISDYSTFGLQAIIVTFRNASFTGNYKITKRKPRIHVELDDIPYRYLWAPCYYSVKFSNLLLFNFCINEKRLESNTDIPIYTVNNVMYTIILI